MDKETGAPGVTNRTIQPVIPLTASAQINSNPVDNGVNNPLESTFPVPAISCQFTGEDEILPSSCLTCTFNGVSESADA